MKRALWIIIGALFFLVLLALVIFKLFPTHTNQEMPPAQDPFANASVQSDQIQNDSSLSTAKTCFAWYVQASGFGANALTSQARQEAAKCFTPNFISQWNSIISSTGGDPVLLAQFVGKTWNIISVSPISQSIHSSDVEVTLGTGEEQVRVIAHVVKIGADGSWRIDSVTSSKVGIP